jgi:cell wall-associated NlpC family hydrolase
MGAHAVRAGLPPELPVMAALTESGLRNVAFGDRDSVGFFQMRQGVWDRGAYAGYLHRPGRQIKWFIEHALAVRAEDPAVAQSPDTWGQWIAKIEQPAAQYRFRYQPQLSVAQELLRGVDFAALQRAIPTRVGEAALQVAMHYLGTPYQWGGSNPSTGFDCSGLVQYAYAQEGVQLPRVAAAQFDVGIPVPRTDLRPGDAVFFAEPGGDVHHVGLYVGDGRFVNAPETGEDVKISSLSDPYFAAQYAGARRYTAGLLGDPSRYARTMPTVGS